ncbi:thioesterase II family protein [Streptomyces malaysiense]|uniref:Thioesterase n=1 Tax=Streptomyces malaysiense TaxID=1428626 RepID=A0A1J4Q6V4_9ACTN|nr:alpha/beta fold hydrolase [Streptomyces malaysiense]OIK28713.1 thioesterase [Streptomyces malaysiense]
MSPAGNDRWIRCFEPRPRSGRRLVCFPHAGGSASHYFALSRALPDTEVLAVQYPGRQDRHAEPCVDSLTGLADRVHDVLRRRAGTPCAFFGHSMGAVIAFEVAQRLQREDAASPSHLFVSSRRAPSRYREGAVHRQSDAGVVSELRRLGGTDERFLADEELRAAVLKVTRADYKAIETYRWVPEPPLTCPITALVGDSDPHTSRDEASAWAAHTTGPFRLHTFPGGHFYLDPASPEVTDVLATALAGTATGGRPERSAS